MVDLVGRPEAMALARPAVGRIVHLTGPFVAGRVEVGELLAPAQYRPGTSSCASPC